MTLLTKKKKKGQLEKRKPRELQRKTGKKNTVESLAPFEINDITTLYLTNTSFKNLKRKKKNVIMQ